MTLEHFLSNNNINNDKFASLIGVSPQAVGRYRKKERIPKPEIMERIFLATRGKVTANDFYTP